MRGWQLTRLIIATGVILAIGYVLTKEMTDPNERLHKFIHERGFVQYAIFGLATFTLVVLYSRQREHLEQQARFARYLRKAGSPPEALGEALSKLEKVSGEYGPAAVRTQVQRFQDEQSKVVQENADTIRMLVGSLPVLGLLGTMLGLSNALYGAFSDGLFGDAQVQEFVAGLSTALDTTVLAMLCAAPLFLWTGFQVRQESRLVDRGAEFLRQRFGVADVPEGDQGIDAMSRELSRLTKQIGQEAQTMFAGLLETSATALRETLGAAVQQHLSEHHQQQLDAAHEADRKVAEQVHEAARVISLALEQQNRELTERVAQAVEQNTRAVQDQVAPPLHAAANALDGHMQGLNARLPQLVAEALHESLAQASERADQRHVSLAERMTDHLGRLETALRNRTPEEVIVRYHHNGKLQQQGA